MLEDGARGLSGGGAGYLDQGLLAGGDEFAWGVVVGEYLAAAGRHPSPDASSTSVCSSSSSRAAAASATPLTTTTALADS